MSPLVLACSWVLRFCSRFIFERYFVGFPWKSGVKDQRWNDWFENPVSPVAARCSPSQITCASSFQCKVVADFHSHIYQKSVQHSVRNVIQYGKKTHIEFSDLFLQRSVPVGKSSSSHYWGGCYKCSSAHWLLSWNNNF